MVHHRTGVVDVDDILLLHRRIVTATIGIDDRATQDLQIGTIQFRTHEGRLTPCNDCFSLFDDIFTIYLFIRILKVTITTGKELSDINLLGIGVLHGSSLYMISCLAIGRTPGRCRCNLFCGIINIRTRQLGADAHIAVEGVGDYIFLRVWVFCSLHSSQLRRLAFSYRHCRTNLSRNIITAIHLID